MTKTKRTKGKTMTYKILHRKVKIELQLFYIDHEVVVRCVRFSFKCFYFYRDAAKNLVDIF